LRADAEGDVDEALQAEYYERTLAVCYSHPAVEMVNLWALGRRVGWRGGVVGREGEPKAAYVALQKAIGRSGTQRRRGRWGWMGGLRSGGSKGSTSVC